MDIFAKLGGSLVSNVVADSASTANKNTIANRVILTCMQRSVVTVCASTTNDALFAQILRVEVVEVYASTTKHAVFAQILRVEVADLDVNTVSFVHFAEHAGKEPCSANISVERKYVQNAIPQDTKHR